MITSSQSTIDYKTEVLRKAIHLCSLSISIIYYHITKELALSILIPLTALSIILDVARYIFPKFGKIFYMIFGFMLRQHEMDEKKRNLNGATYVLLAATIVIAVFPKVFVIPAIAILILGDISAALIGRKFGKNKFLAKSLEGTLAFLAAGSIVIIFSPKLVGTQLEYFIGIIAAGAGAIAENISFGWADDNLTIPIAVCLTMYILYYILLPDVPLVLPNVPV